MKKYIDGVRIEISMGSLISVYWENLPPLCNVKIKVTADEYLIVEDSNKKEYWIQNFCYIKQESASSFMFISEEMQNKEHENIDIDTAVEEIEKLMMYRGEMPEEGKLREILKNFKEE